MSKDIYSRLAEMIEDCSERVKICTPTDWYVDKQWSEDTITVVDTYKLINMLQIESLKDAQWLINAKGILHQVHNGGNI